MFLECTLCDDVFMEHPPQFNYEVIWYLYEVIANNSAYKPHNSVYKKFYPIFDKFLR